MGERAASGGGRVHAIHVSNGGVPKRPVPRARVTVNGVEGDRQADTEHHGGPERAVSVWSLEVIEALQREGHPVVPGAAGENVTVTGVEWSGVGADVRIEIGDEVVLVVTRYAKPCKAIAACFADGHYSRIAHDLHPASSRVYARVVRDGEMRVGDRVRVR